MSSKLNNIQIGFIGFGKFAEKHQITIEKFENAKLNNILKRKKISLKGFKVFTNINTFKKFHYDIILIITPAISHFKIFKQIYKNINKIVIEKPLFSKSSEYDEFISLKYTKDNLIVNYSELFNKNFHIYYKIIKKKKILRVQLEFGIQQKVKDKLFYISEWLPHPLSMLFMIFKNIDLYNVSYIPHDNKFFEVKIGLRSENILIDLFISNNFEPKKRQIKIHTKDNKIIYYSSATNDPIKINNKKIECFDNQETLYNLWNYVLYKKNKSYFDKFQNNLFHKKIIKLSNKIVKNIEDEFKKISFKKKPYRK
ncbi:Gfo/Idh/MocA family oxidoreductase [Alphaproteobacteria bacterium]|nr:Gfo/Idh/MocA family oxidoreductase [Alphaproteobacteria bacterium]